MDLENIKDSIDTLNEKIASAYEAVEVIKAAEVLNNPATPLANQALAQIKSAEGALTEQKFAFVKGSLSKPSLKSDIILYYPYDENGNVVLEEDAKTGEYKTEKYRVARIGGEDVALLVGDTLEEYRYFDIVETTDKVPGEFNGSPVIVVPSTEKACADGIYQNRRIDGQLYYYSKNADGTIANYYFKKDNNYIVVVPEVAGEVSGTAIYVLRDAEGNYYLDDNGNKMYRAGTSVNDTTEYTLMESMTSNHDALEAIVNKYIGGVTFAGNIPEELKITAEDIQNRADLELDDEEEEVEEEKEESRYAADNIIAVTYGTLEGKAYKTMLLNYNNFMVTIVYNGVRYTIPAYGFVAIMN